MSPLNHSVSSSDPQTESLEERVGTLLEELRLAVKWQRPSILLAVYRSELVCALAQRMLEQEVSSMGQGIHRVTVQAAGFDLPLFLSRHPGRDQTVFFVKGLKPGGKREGYHAYRALNIRRELLVDHRIRAVFWLTEDEAVDLPAHAPDFWVFRHRVIEFLEPPVPANISALTGWLVREAGRGTSSPSSIEAVTAFEKAARHEPRNALLWSSLGAIYSSLQRRDDALRVTRKALRLKPDDVNTWLNLGDLYRAEQRLPAARKAYQSALDLDPNNAKARASLAACKER